MKKVETDFKKTFRITPTIVKKYLVYIILLLLGLHVLGKSLKVGFGYSFSYFLVYMFDFDGESNIPATYSTLAILLCAILLWRISIQESEQLKKHSIYWKVLSLIFVMLGFDEYFRIHERLKIDEILGESATGFLHFNWFIPYLIIFGIIGLFFIKFIFQLLPNKTRNSFIIAGVVFLLGAVGCEIIGGKFYSEGPDIFYIITYTIEESLEMLGIVLFMNALMKYWLQDGNIVFYINQDENVFDNEKEELDLKNDHKEESYKKSTNYL